MLRLAVLVHRHTLFGLLDTSSDLGLLVELLYDDRSRGAPPTPFENDGSIAVSHET